MFTTIIFIIVLGILVLVHEFGHFYVAKKAGMKVEEFGFGFPPRIFGIKRGETIYSINWIPFGGFVKIYGENGENENDPRSFASKSAGSKAKVIVAGVIMNFLLAVIFLSFANTFGLRIGLIDDATIARDIKIQVIQVSSDSPAEAAGLKTFDEIIKIKKGNDAVSPMQVEEVQNFIKKYGGEEITMTIKRNGGEIDLKLTPRQNPPAGQGAIGINLAKTGIVFFPWYEAIWRGIRDTVIMTANITIALGLFFKNIFIDSSLNGDVSGPIGIAVITGQAASLGFNYLLQFVALLSINLAVLNIMPFPALDGGRLLFIGIEKLKGSPVPKKIEGFVNAAGFVFLIALMIWITVKDVSRFF
ncbi:MAG: RIP metalloprotease RseP [Parcubacteria group bacterium RIFCSPLOWO2_01_FULL_40_65]|nr:MAG: RIP metalloprotease RseP [Parcubacteria group bacterium RIFCSPHIGHO2_01_FULL_40_30]OHB18978.1 MAG: RIP metalloprotease RseP [Parcubacteria group bacterium RIFCSPHIGHO2_02_FULL_40_12]OHB21167.1 MAG: RIP metalloprotease RseP [Parcubacteria group bacterium RIFCSPLOWO2_01_FULL_40_65]OHB24070.1 MAG: RIP metalloprotease RseP [Parcubacteria group bacterium RIFCSPLOWO2_12_FULL_40_10]